MLDKMIRHDQPCRLVHIPDRTEEITSVKEFGTVFECFTDQEEHGFFEDISEMVARNTEDVHSRVNHSLVILIRKLYVLIVTLFPGVSRRVQASNAGVTKWPAGSCQHVFVENQTPDSLRGICIRSGTRLGSANALAKVGP